MIVTRFQDLNSISYLLLLPQTSIMMIYGWNPSEAFAFTTIILCTHHNNMNSSEWDNRKLRSVGNKRKDYGWMNIIHNRLFDKQMSYFNGKYWQKFDNKVSYIIITRVLVFIFYLPTRTHMKIFTPRKIYNYCY